jgi:hypothetical protein
VAEDHDNLGTGELTGKLHAAEDVVIDEVTCDAGTEEITDALVEYHLYRYARVDTAEYTSKGVLAGGRSFYLLDDAALGRALAEEALIAVY